MQKPILTRAAANSFRDLAIGLGTFFIVALLVGAISTDAFSFVPRSVESQALPADLRSAKITRPAQPEILAMNLPQSTAGILAMPPYKQAIHAQSLSLSDQQMGIFLLAMMFALISLFVRQSTRHLRRASAAKRRQTWQREDWQP